MGQVRMVTQAVACIMQADDRLLQVLTQLNLGGIKMADQQIEGNLNMVAMKRYRQLQAFGQGQEGIEP